MTTPAYQDEHATVYLGDCLAVLPDIPSASVDAIITDPPYGLEFMSGATPGNWDAPWKLGTVVNDPAAEGGFQDGAGGNPYSRSRIRYGGAGITGTGYTDEYVQRGGERLPRPSFGTGLTPMRHYQAWCEAWARECLRVLKPGGHLLACGGTRTFHRLAAGIEDAGFEIRDTLAWLYAEGFPKSLDIAKQIDKTSGIWRGRAGAIASENDAMSGGNYERNPKGEAVTEPAREWQGWGTALKPAHEPIVVARKPFEGTVAANVVKHGTGALNIQACRVATDDGYEKAWDKPISGSSANVVLGNLVGPGRKRVDISANKPTGGRWPPNVLLDPTSAAELDRQSGTSRSTQAEALNDRRQSDETAINFGGGRIDPGNTHADAGGASRFFPIFEPEPEIEPDGPQPLWHKRPSPTSFFATEDRPWKHRLAEPEHKVGRGPKRWVSPRGMGYRGVPDPGPCEYVESGEGRWPPNVLLDQHAAAELDAQSGQSASRRGELTSTPGDIYGGGKGLPSYTGVYGFDDQGGASRFYPVFFYTPKANSNERPTADEVRHPTVKPTPLLAWLVRLVVPPHGLVLDPFAGTGTTAEACIRENKRCILVEREPSYLPLIVARLTKPIQLGLDFDPEPEEVDPDDLSPFL